MRACVCVCVDRPWRTDEKCCEIETNPVEVLLRKTERLDDKCIIADGRSRWRPQGNFANSAAFDLRIFGADDFDLQQAAADIPVTTRELFFLQRLDNCKPVVRTANPRENRSGFLRFNLKSYRNIHLQWSLIVALRMWFIWITQSAFNIFSYVLRSMK